MQYYTVDRRPHRNAGGTLLGAVIGGVIGLWVTGQYLSGRRSIR